MQTKLPAKISTIKEAKAFLWELNNNKESYHPEDSAKDIIDANGKELFTEMEAEKLDALMIDIYNLKGNDGRHINLAFDPCEFLLDLENIFQYVDKSGRGFKTKISLAQIKDDTDEFSYNGESLKEWAEIAEEGEIWEDAATKYIKI